MSFHAFDVALELVRSVQQPLTVIAQHDPNLASQLRRAVSSVPLNLAEGNRRAGRDRLHLFRIAAGSTAEAVAGLRIAEAWGYVEAGALEPALTFCDRVQAMCWRLTH